MKTRFTMSRTGQTVCYGSVFEVKKEIPVLMADPSPIPARRNMDKLPRTIAAIVLLFVTSAIITYLFAVVTGHVHKENRLGLPEVGLGLVACLFLILVIYPAAFDRLSLLKLPGGIEVTLEKIQRQQVEQRRELDAFFSILANLLSPPEKYHLRLLGRPESDETYTGQSSLRDDIYRLKRYQLVEEVEGQKIGDMLDGRRFLLRSFVRLTPQGEQFIKALDKIEAS